jgi:hypothetical protein
MRDALRFFLSCFQLQRHLFTLIVNLIVRIGSFFGGGCDFGEIQYLVDYGDLRHDGTPDKVVKEERKTESGDEELDLHPEYAALH